MKKTIRIFVAGSQELTTERDALKALAHDLNKSYRYSGITFEFQSCDDPVFKDNQHNYNNYIKNNADIVIFVLKDDMRNFTRQEFEKAAEAYKEKNLPEIMVFMNGYSDEKLGTKEMKDFIKKHLGEHHYIIPYDRIEDLKHLAKDRIRNFATPIYKQLHRTQMLTIAAFAAFLLVLTGVLAWKVVSQSNTPKLLFAGGGSALNYIQESANIDIKNWRGALYASMPSGTSWPLMAEEYNRHENRNGNKDLKFVTLVISAGKANTAVMLKSCDRVEFNNKATIVESKIGYDTLCIYIQKDFYEKHKERLPINKNEITAKDFREVLLKNDNLHALFFATAESSGTRNQYNQCLINDTATDIRSYAKHVTIFNEADAPGVYTNKPYVIMGSEYYYPKVLDKKGMAPKDKYEKIILKDDKGKAIRKPIYLYFVAFTDVSDDTKYVHIPDPIYKVLRKIKKTNKIIEEDEELREHHRLLKTSIITHLKPSDSDDHE